MKCILPGDMHARRDRRGDVCSLVCKVLDVGSGNSLGVPMQLACHHAGEGRVACPRSDGGVIPERTYNALIDSGATTMNRRSRRRERNTCRGGKTKSRRRNP